MPAWNRYVTPACGGQFTVAVPPRESILLATGAEGGAHAAPSVNGNGADGVLAVVPANAVTRTVNEPCVPGGIPNDTVDAAPTVMLATCAPPAKKSKR